jgi:hypothetical protein
LERAAETFERDLADYSLLAPEAEKHSPTTKQTNQWKSIPRLMSCFRRRTTSYTIFGGPPMRKGRSLRWSRKINQLSATETVMAQTSLPQRSSISVSRKL